MRAASKDFGAANNTPWLAEVTLYLETGAALDLSGYDSFVMHVKTDAFDPAPQCTPTVTFISGGDNNVLRIAAPVADVEGLWGDYVYDVIGIVGGEPLDQILQGTIKVNQGVTVV